MPENAMTKAAKPVAKRMTKQRRIIKEILCNTTSHPTAEAIHEEAKKVLPDISLGTVYRNLSLLTDHHMIRSFIVDGIIRYDKNIVHDHFICDKCKCIIDVPKNIDNNNKYIDGNLVIDYDIKYKGICRECQRKE